MSKRNDLLICTVPQTAGENFTNPVTELKIKLIEIGNPMPNIILTRESNFPIIDWQMETAGGGTRESQAHANALLHICTGSMFASIYRAANKAKLYSRCPSD